MQPLHLEKTHTSLIFLLYAKNVKLLESYDRKHLDNPFTVKTECVTVFDPSKLVLTKVTVMIFAIWSTGHLFAIPFSLDDFFRCNNRILSSRPGNLHQRTLLPWDLQQHCGMRPAREIPRTNGERKFSILLQVA